MIRKIDWSRPYDKVSGPGEDHLYEQDYLKFDHDGNFVGKLPNYREPSAPEPGVYKKELTAEETNRDLITVLVEPEDEDVKLEALHDKLTALGVKFHHRAKVETLQKLLDGVLQKRSEEEAA